MLNPVTPEFESHLRSQLPAQCFRDIAPHYLEEPRGQFPGQAGLVLAPATTDEVAVIVRAANDARVGLIPMGGGTGLVGGQTMPDGPLPALVSLERMTAIRHVYPEENVLVAEAGAILQDIQTAARAADRLFPLSLASQGSARIGGNLATNAGGVNVVRYGNTRDLCLGIEAVMPTGAVLHGLSRLRKDNTGYDLRHLLIGAEGTLGIITAATLRLFPRPKSEATALLAVRDPDAALSLLSLAQERTGNAISMFELIERTGLDFLEETGLDFRDPFETRPTWMVLVELCAGQGQIASEMLEALFEAAYEAGLVSDGVVGASEAQRAALWQIRETIPEANKRVGPVMSNDISLPLSRIPEFIRRAPQAIAAIGDFRINCFGHMGDGNLHYNVFPASGRDRSEYQSEKPKLRDAIYDLVAAMDGSFSAEHGIGRLKTDDLVRYGDPVKLASMRAIKSALDPNGIMNPGAVLRP